MWAVDEGGMREWEGLKGGHSCDLQNGRQKRFLSPRLTKDKHVDRAHYSLSVL